MDELLRRLLNQLDAIGAKHEELYDTECREQTSGAVFDGFVRPADGFVLPEEFGLFSSEGNRAVREVLAAYIRAANGKASELGITSFHERLAALQNDEVVSDIERNDYDDFFGWSPPDAYDSAGNAIGQY